MVQQIAEEEAMKQKYKTRKRLQQNAAAQKKAIAAAQAPKVSVLPDLEERNNNVPDSWEDEAES